MRKKTVRLILAAFALLAVYCVLIEPTMIEYTTHEIPVDGLPRSFDGFKIVQIADIHLNIWTTPAKVRAIVQRVNAMHPDLVVLTGDYASSAKSDCMPCAKALGGLRAKHGVYAVLGNHDYYSDGSMLKALRDQGFTVLSDEKREVTIGRGHLQLIGTNDAWYGHPDYKKAFMSVTSGEPCICIAHNPDAVLSLKGRPIDLLITGHTHGGLVNLPFYGPVQTIARVGRKNSVGMFTMNGIRTYVSRGIGTGKRAHIRFRCRPEVPVFILKCAR
jgi:uncharacterized protein